MSDTISSLGASVPAGLPDPAELARLAGAFFAALPGQPPASLTPASPALVPGSPSAATSQPGSGGVPVPSGVQPAGLSLPPGTSGPSTPTAAPSLSSPWVVPGANLIPHSPQAAANFGASLPARAPHAQAPNGVPDVLLMGAPGADGRLGSHVLGVPPAPMAQSPAVATHSTPPPESVNVSPYYFVGEGAAQRPASPDVSIHDALVPLPHGLPGNDALRDLLSDRRAPLQTTATTPARPPASAAQTSAYYFLEGPGAGLPGGDQRPASERPQVGGSAHPPFDVNAVRRDFPILQERVNGRPLVWFDNAATTQKPQAVIDRLAHFYAHENSNIHRAAHELAARATDAYEQARETVRRFINAPSPEEVIFVRGTTEAINLVAKSWGSKNIGPGDEIIVSHLEHHANIVPWQQLAAEKGAKIRVIPVDDSGQVILSEYQRLLSDRTKIVSVTQVSNALGTVVPVQEIVALAHRAGAKALVDGAQSVSHMRVDVTGLDADFFVFSGHKIFGPTGIGALFGKRELLEDMPPWQGGGNMIADVTFERTVFQPPPNKFEAGTGNIADAVGLGAALEYVERIGIENIGRYEHDLLEYATHHLRPIAGVRLVGTARDKASVLSFVLDGYTTEEVGKALNQEGIAVRTGHHCAQPILRRFGLETTVRPSLAFYNTCEEVDRFIAVIRGLSQRRNPNKQTP